MGFGNIQFAKFCGIFLIGVGGSAANCSHMVNDFRKICELESYTPTDNVSELTARINDDGWDSSFANWLKISNLNKKDAFRPQYMSKSIHSGNDRGINKHGHFLRFTSRAFHSKRKIHHSTL